jgi:hypothetical protein
MEIPVDWNPVVARTRILTMLLEERLKAELKFPDQHLAQGTGPEVRPFSGNLTGLEYAEANALTAGLFARMAKAECQAAGTPENPDTWLKVIGEEFWEYAEASDREHVKAELVQVGAMVLRALEDILREEEGLNDGPTPGGS